VLGFALTACDDSSSAGGDNGSGGNRGGIPDTVETFMELSDYDCGKSQKCVATYLTEYHNMAVCDGDNGWVIGTLIEKMDCDFSSSSAKATDKDSEPAEVSCSSVEKGLPDSDAKSSSSAKETKTSSDSKSSSSVKSGDSSSSSSAGKVNCPALLEGKTHWSWDVPKECRFNPDIDYGSMTDERDGKVYRTVTIGDQVWMAENLNYANGVKTPSLNGRNWCCDDKPANCNVGGRLYTWAAAIDSVKTGCGYGSTCSPTLPVQGICPTGWHLPSNVEWNTLFTAVGGSDIAGKVLKSQSDWYSNGNGTDTFGFSALPAGYRSRSGEFIHEGSFAYFWSSTEYNSYHAYRIYLGYGSDDPNLDYNYKYIGYSIRCVKDSE
jgi:uncharacterized protein (TIGR02145 family)